MKYMKGLLVGGIIVLAFFLAGCGGGDEQDVQQRGGDLSQAPEGLSARPGFFQIELSWVEVTGAESYNLYWSTGAGVSAAANVIEGVASPYVHSPIGPLWEYRYRVAAVNGNGESLLSTEVSARPKLPALEGRITASDPQGEDHFGFSVAFDGECAVVGAPNENGGDGDPITFAGAAYVFCRDHGGEDAWGQAARLAASDARESGHFGSSVAISGNYAVVGAIQTRLGLDDLPVDTGAAYVFYRHQGGTDAWGEVARLTPPDGQAGDYFGRSVAISGDYAVVGAPYEAGGEGDPLPDAGAAYIYYRHQGGTDSWGELAKLTSSDLQGGDAFGWSVAIGGDFAVVGATGEDGGAGNPLPSAGAAYIFCRDLGGTDAWGQMAKLASFDLQGGDAFGWSVAMSGDLVIVGATGEDGGAGNPLPSAGAAYIFCRDGGGADAWGEVARLQASDAHTNDQFGQSVSISGQYAAVGAPYNGNVGGTYPDAYAGAAYVFYRDQGGTDAWGQRSRHKAGNFQEYGRFGCSVSITDRGFLAGSSGEGGGYMDPLPQQAGAAYVILLDKSSNRITSSDASISSHLAISVSISGDFGVAGASGDNAAYVFFRNQGGAEVWGQVARLTASEPQPGGSFGNSVAIDGDWIIVGSPYQDGDDGGSLDRAGAAYVFSRNQGGADAWGQVARLTASDMKSLACFGNVISMSGDYAIVGAIQDGSVDYGSWGLAGNGAAYVFYRHQGGTDAWGQVAKLTASDGEAGDQFGSSVFMTADYAVVGATSEDGGLGSPAPDAGAAYVFYRHQGGTDAWGQVARLAASDGEAGDLFGSSVSMTADYAVVGAMWEDGGMGSPALDAGAAYLFSRHQGGTDAWGEVVKLTSPEDKAGCSFGCSVAMRGDLTVVGAPGADGGIGGSYRDAGYVYVFSRNQGGMDAWGLAGSLWAPDGHPGDKFGSSVSIGGDHALVGAPEDDGAMVDPMMNIGSAYWF